MCGIVGYVGTEEAVGFLTPALKRLEYRGYDSAGIATLNGHGLEVCKSAGKIAQLESAVEKQRPLGHVGIAHTRWATHGRPSTVNAHPHLDCGNRIAVVHNGIIENYHVLRERLTENGHRFRSETDTEVIAHLIEQHADLGLAEAVRHAARVLHGSFAIACISEDMPDTIVALRGGSSPLVMSLGDDGAYLASDVPALVGRARDTIILADGELAVLTRGRITIRRFDGRVVHRRATPMRTDAAAVEKGGYPHFMLKEIFEQPDVIRRTLAEQSDASQGHIALPEVGLSDRDLARVRRVAFVACGTSWHAGVLGRYLVEQIAGLPAEAELASESRHRQPIYDGRVLVVPISQSGETADTLAAVRQARAAKTPIVCICNVAGSSIVRESDGVLPTSAGLEIGVAATKSFTSQVLAVTLLAARIAMANGRLDKAGAVRLLTALATAPALMAQMLDDTDAIRAIASRLAAATSSLYLGRGLQYPLALEGALKLKEIAYIHAEGHAAGELKHGPIALIQPDVPVIALAPTGPTSAAMASSMQEVKARDGSIVALATRGDAVVSSLADAVIALPPADPILAPLVLAVPLQLLAYHTAVLRACDVDQPRNLAKSVTVE